MQQRSKNSAGLILYRIRGDELQVLLGHMGGPLWAGKDKGAWSIPKGAIDPGEDPFQAALREFAEEVGAPPTAGKAIELGAITQRSGKKVHAWAIEGDLDPADQRSNTFQMEWPPRSGVRKRFPEIDRVQWFNVSDAQARAIGGQGELFHRLALAISLTPRPGSS